MDDFMNACSTIMRNLQDYTCKMDTSYLDYTLEMFHIERKNLKDTLLDSTSDKAQKIVEALAKRYFKKVNCLSYAIVARYLLQLEKLPYSVFVGFSCPNEDKALFESIHKDLSKHPFPANHIYVQTGKGKTTVTYECLVTRNKQFFNDIVHADMVKLENTNGGK